ncbi:MurR/RpiR family transcriptional regulator [Thomasclavelia sp.]
MKFNELICMHYNELNENDKDIIKFIEENKNTCFNYSISQFAKECLVSKTSLVRFAQKIGLPGFGELKALLKWDGHNNDAADDNLIELVSLNYHQMIDDISKRDFSNIFNNLDNCKRLIVYGSGYGQARVASEFKRIFLPTGKTIICMNGYDMIDSLKKVVNTDDYVIIISLSGEKEKIVEFSKYLKIMKINCLSITRMKSNPLASICDDSLYINSIKIPSQYQIDYEIATPYFMLIEMMYIYYQKHLESNCT